MTSSLRAASATSLLVLAAGCRVLGPDFSPPAAPTATTFHHSDAASNGPPIVEGPPIGSAFYSDPALDELIADAFVSSPTPPLAAARLAEAAARRGLTRSETRPTLTAGATVQVAGEAAERRIPLPSGSAQYRTRGDSYRLPLEASYEIDLWGRVRRAIESAQASLRASEADSLEAHLQLSIAVAETYFGLLGENSELASLRRAQAVRAEQTELFETRVRAGLANELDWRRSQIELAATQADLAGTTARREQTLSRLAWLTGRPIGELAVRPSLSAATVGVPPRVPVGLPAELIRRRAAVRAAEERWHARVAEIGVTQAAAFPSIRLTGTAGFESEELSSLLDRPARFWGFGPTIRWPLLDGGRNRANLAIARARADAAEAEYRAQVLLALREVEDALITIRQSALQAAAQQEAYAAATVAVEIARARFDQGLVSLLEVLDAERNQLSAERALSQLQAAQHAGNARLIGALGGGWSVPTPVVAAR
ncbi:MAG TPA: efflux transporter outer membrane subunit [Candidatus Synoicihabitans sp.]|nr:efflux transporter outer membrane subunit [Candidatus Synoicihabitans sp.]